MAVDAVTPIELRDMFSQSGVTLTLEVARGGQIIVTTLRLEHRL
jgi:hypothetical protein